jgi:photosystem II stability/assembly factor-like uncharacterized protein
MTSTRNTLALSLLVWSLSGQIAWPAGSQDVLGQPATQGSQAQHAVLLGVARAGERLVAVGERGIVLISADSGDSWRQASVPVSTTLTAVQFVDAMQGWAVGHGGVVLHSADGGESWQLQLDGVRAAALELAQAMAAGRSDMALQRQANAQRLVDDGADKPLLALHFSDARKGIVIGAYGLALQTSDGGQTWVSWMGRLPNPRGLHYYAVAEAGDQFYLAGEQGLLLASNDGGERFSALQSPYEGSYFSLALLPDGAVVVGGLRGKLFRSCDRGHSFKAMANPVPVSINAALVVGQQLLLVNQAGGLLRTAISVDAVRPVPLPPGAPLSAVVQAPDGSLVGVGFAGPVRLASSALAASQSMAE